MTISTDRRLLSRRGFLAGAIALAATAAGCAGRLLSYRYRMIVEVETPAGLRTGSSVIEVLIRKGSGIPNDNLSDSFRGEAAAVDLPNGQTLFALPTGERNSDAFDTFANAAFYPRMRAEQPPVDELSFEDRVERLKAQKGRATLPRVFLLETINFTVDSYPLLVRFKDVRDPKSLERVDPDDLESSFGPGYRLKGIYIEMTTDEVENTMARRLPWLKDFAGKPIKGPDDHLASLDWIDDITGYYFSSEAVQ